MDLKRGDVPFVLQNIEGVNQTQSGIRRIQLTMTFNRMAFFTELGLFRETPEFLARLRAALPGHKLFYSTLKGYPKPDPENRKTTKEKPPMKCSSGALAIVDESLDPKAVEPPKQDSRVMQATAFTIEPTRGYRIGVSPFYAHPTVSGHSVRMYVEDFAKEMEESCQSIAFPCDANLASTNIGVKEKARLGTGLLKDPEPFSGVKNTTKWRNGSNHLLMENSGGNCPDVFWSDIEATFVRGAVNNDRGQTEDNIKPQHDAFHGV